MIKVIASDMDGTLLNNQHRLAPETLAAINRACDAGIRFMVATGRNFQGAMEELKGTDLTCDYIVGSGAEVRNPRHEVVSQVEMDGAMCREVYEEIKKFQIPVIFCTDGYDYKIGSKEDLEAGIIRHLKLFHLEMDDSQIRETVLFRQSMKQTRSVLNIEELLELDTIIYKIFLMSDDTAQLEQLGRRLERDRRIAVASSFRTNLEITDVKAQKGPVLKEYIESLGYQMDEVMVLGDSMNDYSMISMDFGATVAMENAMPEIKQAAKYVTRSNQDFGVAYAIEQVLKKDYNI